MQTYHFQTCVQGDGSVSLSNLPPFARVEIVVVEFAPSYGKRVKRSGTNARQVKRDSAL